MRIVTACVHYADALTVVFRGNRGLEGNLDLLGHRQRVHVGPQRHHRTRALAAQHADDSRLGHAGAHFQPEALQLRGDDARRPHLTVAKLGMLVQVAAPGDHLRIDIGGAPIDLLMNGARCQDLVRLRVCRNRADEGDQPQGGGVESQADRHP